MNPRFRIAGPLAAALSLSAWGQTSIDASAPGTDLAEPAAVQPTAVERLAALTPARRSGASIQVELIDSASPIDHEIADSAANDWNGGEQEAALAKLGDLQAQGVLVGIGASWEDAEPSQDDATRSGLGSTRRIGGARIGAGEIALAEDRDTGFLYVVVGWEDGDWTLNRSVNGGLSWLEKYTWFGENWVPAVDVDVAAGYVYVAYRTGTASPEPDHVVRWRRFNSVGDPDVAYGAVTVFSGGLEYYHVRLASSSESASDFERIYCVATDFYNDISYAWDDAIDGESISVVPTGIGDAAYGVDITVSSNLSTTFSSYVDLQDRVHVLRRRSGVWTNTIIDDDFTGGSHRTSISADGDTVICAYEGSILGLYYTIKYQITHDGGETWQPGTLALNLSHSYSRPAVTLKGGYGIGAAFFGSIEVGPDTFAFRTKPGLSGDWSNIQETDVNDTWLSTSPIIDAIEPSILSPESLYAYGVVYVADADLKAFFRRWDHCPGDVDGDGLIGIADLAELLSRFGAADIEQGEAADLDGDGIVGISDLAYLISAYGTACS